EAIAAFLAAQSPERDEAAQRCIAFAAAGQQHEAAAGGRCVAMQLELRADDEVDERLPALVALLLGLRMRAHHARDRAFVGEGDGAVAELLRTLDELLWVRGAGEEAEVAAAVQLRIVGQAARLGQRERKRRQRGARRPRRWLLRHVALTRTRRAGTTRRRCRRVRGTPSAGGGPRPRRGGSRGTPARRRTSRPRCA